MARTVVTPGDTTFFPPGRYTFSPGMQAGGYIWLSGQTASRYDAARGRVMVEGDLAAQARTAYDKVRAVLHAAGLRVDQAIQAVEYVPAKDVSAYPSTDEARRAAFGPAPAAVVVPVRGLVRPEARFEADVTASRTPVAAVEIPTPAGSGAPAARTSGDLLVIPGVVARQTGVPDRIEPGGVMAQARRIYSLVGAVLAVAGFGWEHVVKTVEYITPAALAEYRETAAVRREHFRSGFPAATGIVVPRLAHPDALMQVDFIASKAPRRTLNPGWHRYEALTYAPAVRSGDLLFLSGQLALDPETGMVQHAGDVVAQCRFVYQTISRLLAAAGAGTEAIVKTVEYVAPAAAGAYAGTAAVRREFFAPLFPAATGVICERLLRTEALIEIDAVAVLA